MTQITIIDAGSRRVEATADPGRGSFLISPDRLPEALGWELKPSGLCQESTCVPVGDVGSLRVGDQLDLMAVARALGRPAVSDVDAGLMAVALPAELRRQALEDLRAPEFELPDVGREPPRPLRVGRPQEGPGDLLQLVRLPLRPARVAGPPRRTGVRGFTVVAVAIDQSAEDVRPWIDGITMPVLYDPNHVLTESYAISNVPTVVWIDEEDNIARPNGVAFGSDLFADFTGVEAAPHLDELRRWARHGEVPVTRDEAREAVGDLSEDEVLARLHFRLAAEAHRQGDEGATRRHVATASALAPDDLTIWRAGMPLVGEDPFGDRFLAKYEEWKQKGMPYHGLPPVTGSDT